jgi:hypothetical protein
MTKLILNNCIDCGRVPLWSYSGSFNNSCLCCSCGRTVYSNGKIWSQEVAADMWNRANQAESALDVKGVYLNWLAGELARYRLRVMVTENGLKINETCPTDEETGDEIERLLRQCRLHTQDLTEFYRKRLEPAV